MKRGFTPDDENKASNGINNLALIFIAGRKSFTAEAQRTQRMRRRRQFQISNLNSFIAFLSTPSALSAVNDLVSYHSILFVKM